MFKCFKFMYLFSSWILFISALLIVPCLTFNCFHDKVDQPQRRSTRSLKYQDIKNERVNDPTLFECLDIHFYIDKVDKSVSLNTFHNIELALEKVKTFIHSTFKVRKRKRPYLVERSSCTSRWETGKNRGKCSAVSNMPELCDTKAIKYVIPDRYLNKIETYEYDKSEPKISLRSGPGLQFSNFITFVVFQNEAFCAEGAIAYGSYCRMDPKTSEPLSGILNLCPEAFSKDITNFHYFYDVILHEMFHILGFSVKLFDKFSPCVKGTSCNMPQNIIQEDSNKIYRLMFPLVIGGMQRHTGCYKSDFGAPMAPTDPEDAIRTSLPYTSHWHPVLMYSSIMTPSFTEFEHLLVDEMTLATLSSTGWYEVNVSSVDTFNFGRDQGCDFGVSGSCENRFLCNISEANLGCDIYHRTIGKCENLTVHHPCGVYVPNNEKSCEPDDVARFRYLDFEVLGFKQKCFMMQESNSTKPKPSCLPVWCQTEDTYKALVNSIWFPCYQSGETTEQNITLYCPEGVSLCHDVGPQVQPRSCPADLYFFVAIRMYFEQPTFEKLLEQENFKNFKVAVIKAIAGKIDIPVNYIANSSLSVFKQIFLDFAICPPPDLSSKELNRILKNIQKFLDENFVYILKGPPDQFISSNDIKIDPVDVIMFSDYDGFRALLVFPVICAIFLIASFVASVVRLLLLQKHRPRRATENIDDDDNIQMSYINSP